MIAIDDSTTIEDAFFRAAVTYPHNSLFSVPANEARTYLPGGMELDYGTAAMEVRRLMASYRKAGYGGSHRVGLLLENRPDHMLHKLAVNAIGACCVPINPDYRSGEMAYLIEHSRLDLIVVLSSRLEQVEAALSAAGWKPPVAVVEDSRVDLPPALSMAMASAPSAGAPASILYTSGTTGRPKGCVLSQRYELAAGAWYATRQGLAQMRDGQERLYNPLPLFHVNASILSFYCMLLTGGCQVQADRFQPSQWWNEVRASGATIVHYLGVIVSMLLAQPADRPERDHKVRFGVGAGVEPQLHAAFEQRFGFPLLEIWGMTETVRILIDNNAPRQVGTRAFGRAQPGLEVKVIDDAGRDVPSGSAGEMLVRHSEETPRKDFFSGYLDDEGATEAAWRGGWFHTGDIVTRSTEGMLHFVDRRKNIIRRSGENIAAAQVEAMLQTHPLVRQVAVLAVADELREEEVLACIALNDTEAGCAPADDQAARAEVARTLFDFCLSNLAYYKAPGWIWITDHIPTTGTQKIQKHSIFPAGTDPRRLDRIIDLRAFKKRSNQVGHA